VGKAGDLVPEKGDSLPRGKARIASLPSDEERTSRPERKRGFTIHWGKKIWKIRPGIKKGREKD